MMSDEDYGLAKVNLTTHYEDCFSASKILSRGNMNEIECVNALDFLNLSPKKILWLAFTFTGKVTKL